MPTATLMPSPRQRFVDNVGLPLANGMVFTFAAGTSDKLAAYQDQAGLIPHENPIRLDIRGEATIYWLGNYKVDVRTALGIQLPGYPVDNFSAVDAAAAASGSVAAFSQSSGSSLIGFKQIGSGSIDRTVQARLRETVSVMDFGATGNGSTNDTQAFTDAATRAAQLGVEVFVPAPALSYLLSSSPSIPRNVSINASPSWFTGAGLLPFHRFIQKSEGLDPRAFSIKSLNYAESDPNETKRKWALVGWVDITDNPASGYAGTLTDAVGVDGRVRVSAPNGRGFASAFLGQLDPGSAEQAQIYGQEIDINNNLANCDTDANPIARGQVVVSGGTFRPRSGWFLQATRSPSNTLGDNRWNFGHAIYTDACYEACYYIYDGNNCDALSIPTGSRGIHYRGNANTVNFYTRMNSSTFNLEHTISPGKEINVLNNIGEKVTSFQESCTDLNKPLGLADITAFSLPTSVNADLADIYIFGAPGTVTGGITGALTIGRVITLVNASGGSVVINRNANMRTASGAAVTLANLQAVQFVFSGGTYFQISTPTTNS